MALEILDRLRIRDGKLGYVKTADDSVIILRVAVVGVTQRQEESPFGIDFNVTTTQGIAVYPSGAVASQVKDRPMVESPIQAKDGWERIDIADKAVAYEEVVYTDRKLGSYVIRVEMEPLMVARNLRYRSTDGSPLYVVKWITKVYWTELKETPQPAAPQRQASARQELPI